MSIEVVNKHHKVPYTLYIGRGSKWGNPFTHMEGTSGIRIAETREQSIEMYRIWIQTQPALMESLHELDGHTLGCFCKPAMCHGDVLKELREQQIESGRF